MTIRDLVPRFGRGRERVPVQHGERDPFSDLQREMNRLFDDFFSDSPLALRRDERNVAAAGFEPRIDVSESGKEVKISAELPGMDEKNVSVELDDSIVTIRGEKREEKSEEGENWYRREQTHGSFHRSVPLPASVDSTRAKAKFKKGVLTVTLPKKKSDRPQRTSVTIESD